MEEKAEVVCVFMLHYIVVMSEMLSVVVGFHNYVACVSLLSAGQLASMKRYCTTFHMVLHKTRIGASLRIATGRGILQNAGCYTKSRPQDRTD